MEPEAHPPVPPARGTAAIIGGGTLDNLTDMSVVITGASSGIGRATALAFAERGASVTLASRRRGRLAELAQECVRAGGQAQYIETNVTDPVAMRALAQAAVRRYGKVDVWLNNAGIGAVGAFTDTPVEAHDQVIQTNLLGTLHGAHAALPLFQARGEGVLINVISFGAFMGTPLAASYTASKFGMRGLSESLRAELQDYSAIHICDVYPGFVDTPGVRHAANYTGHELHPTPPDRPEDVARAIVRVAVDPQDKTSVGALAKLAPVAYAVAPGLGRWLMARAFGLALSRTPAQAATSGALFSPVDDDDGPQQARIGLGAGLGVLLLGAAALAYQRRRP